MTDSFQAYGFDYAFNGYRHTFTILATSEEEAQAKAQAMSSFSFVGELKPSEITLRTNDSAELA
jgi:hypothetical protein